MRGSGIRSTALLTAAACLQNEREASQKRLHAQGGRTAHAACADVPTAEHDAADAQATAMRRRLAFETKNSGNYERVYPLPKGAAAHAQAEGYAECLAVAEQCFEAHVARQQRVHLDGLAAKRRLEKARTAAQLTACPASKRPSCRRASAVEAWLHLK
jgi:hypothetical protein